MCYYKFVKTHFWGTFLSLQQFQANLTRIKNKSFTFAKVSKAVSVKSMSRVTFQKQKTAIN